MTTPNEQSNHHDFEHTIELARQAAARLDKVRGCVPPPEVETWTNDAVPHERLGDRLERAAHHLEEAIELLCLCQDDARTVLLNDDPAQDAEDVD